MVSSDGMSAQGDNREPSEEVEKSVDVEKNSSDSSSSGGVDDDVNRLKGILDEALAEISDDLLLELDEVLKEDEPVQKDAGKAEPEKVDIRKPEAVESQPADSAPKEAESPSEKDDELSTYAERDTDALKNLLDEALADFDIDDDGITVTIVTKKDDIAAGEERKAETVKEEAQGEQAVAEKPSEAPVSVEKSDKAVIADDLEVDELLELLEEPAEELGVPEVVKAGDVTAAVEEIVTVVEEEAGTAASAAEAAQSEQPEKLIVKEHVIIDELIDEVMIEEIAEAEEAEAMEAEKAAETAAKAEAEAMQEEKAAEKAAAEEELKARQAEAEAEKAAAEAEMKAQKAEAAVEAEKVEVKEEKAEAAVEAEKVEVKEDKAEAAVEAEKVEVKEEKAEAAVEAEKVEVKEDKAEAAVEVEKVEVKEEKAEAAVEAEKVEVNEEKVEAAVEIEKVEVKEEKAEAAVEIEKVEVKEDKAEAAVEIEKVEVKEEKAEAAVEVEKVEVKVEKAEAAVEAEKVEVKEDKAEAAVEAEEVEVKVDKAEAEVKAEKAEVKEDKAEAAVEAEEVEVKVDKAEAAVEIEKAEVKEDKAEAKVEKAEVRQSLEIVFDEKVDDVNALFNEAIALVEGKSGKSGKTAELSDKDSKAAETSNFKTRDLETVSITGDASTAVKKAEEIIARPPVKKKPSKVAEPSVKAPEKPVREEPPVLLKADESTAIDETQLSRIGTFGDIYKTFLHVLINPGSYFETTYLSALEALNYIMVFYFLQMLFQVGYYFMGVRFSVKKLIYIGVFLLIVYVGLIVATAVLSLFVHILASSFNGKGRYGVCFSITAYAGGTMAGAAIAVLFIYRLFLFAGGKIFLFVLAAAMILYGIYIIVKGLKEQYELNENMAYLISFIAFAPVSLYLFFYLPVYFTKFLQIKIPGVQ